MLKKLEVENLESHVHSVLEEMHPGVNLIRGESNCGKTALIRALKLVAYQEFDPKSVRIGTAKCEVLVETERGTVKALRGPKSNLWEVTPKGQPTKFFDKVGKQTVPDAAKIIGMGLVKLGDVDVPVNIMDQLESHFMLSSIGGKEASGSMRAQIIDEISGLSGIEGVIKAVSLDNHRGGREITELEEQLKTVRKQLHDEKQLEAEATLLSAAEKLLKDHKDCAALADEMFQVQSELHTLDTSIEELETKQASFPDLNRAKQLLVQVTEAIIRANALRVFQDEYNRELQVLRELEKKQASFPDLNKAKQMITQVTDSTTKVAALQVFQDEYNRERQVLQELEKRLHDIRKKGSPAKTVTSIAEMIAKTALMGKLKIEIDSCDKSVENTKKQLTSVQQQLQAKQEEKTEILKTVKVCPLTLKPVSPQCLEEK